MPPPTFAHDTAHQAFTDTAHDAFQWTAAPFDPGDRMCPPSSVRRGGTFLPAALVVGVLSAGGWAYVRYPDVWARASVLVTSLAPPVTAPAPATDTAAVPAAAQSPGPPPREVTSAPGQDTGHSIATAPPALAPSVTSAAEPTAEQPADQDEAAPPPKPEPLAKPIADPSNPQQRRALAVGLHPDLSQAVLKRLTGADFKNAGIAILKALSASPDGAAVSWPEARTPSDKLALFEVRFVASSAPDCRRYVVTVTLDRWASTAPAMEKCGADLPKSRLRASTG